MFFILFLRRIKLHDYEKINGFGFSNGHSSKLWR